MRGKIAGFVGCLLLAACGLDPREARELQAKVEALETEVALIKYAPAASSDELVALSERVAALEARGPRGYAEISTSSDGYSIANTDLGPVLVRLGELEVHGRGSKVQMFLGNITSVSIQNPGLILVYTADPDAGRPPGPYTVTHTHLGAVVPATWVPVTVVIPELKPDQLGEIKVFVSASIVQMR
tara:strand:- start:12209 stop:12766 length:558 start_codon:yes stop_codon:yes gene_type:complete